MESLEIAIERIELMEQYFDALLAALQGDGPDIRRDGGLSEKLSVLMDYYENGLWLHDYSLDERGLLPGELKRGILSEDGFYNFLCELENT